MRPETRVYNRQGARAGVLSETGGIKGAAQRTTLVLPTAVGFEAMWNRAIEPPAVLDKREADKRQ